MRDDSTVHHLPSARRFEYDNGSMLAYGGMLDEGQREQLRSIGLGGGIDIAWMEEANRFTEDDFNELMARLRGSAASWRQIILTTNPDSPAHWIKKRLIDGGEASVHYSHAVDNPYNPDDYIEILGSLTGVLRERLHLGRWVQATGVVYEDYQDGIHQVDAFDPPAPWRRFRAIDFGYWPSPFVCQWWCLSPDERVYLYREVWATMTITDDMADRIVELSRGERIEATVSDHDAEDQEVLVRHGIGTVNARKEIKLGVETVTKWLRVAPDGKPRLYFMRGALTESDARMEEDRRPTSTLEEITMYVWPRTTDGRTVKEVPVKGNDHGLDAMRYMIMYLDQQPSHLGQQTSRRRPVTAGMRSRKF